MAKVTKRIGPHPYVQYLLEKTWGYGKWQQTEGLPIVRGHHVDDVKALPLAPWERMGGRGTFINLSDQSVDDAYVLELGPGEAGKPQRHVFEEIVYVLEGRGATELRQEGREPTSFEWQEGSLFTIPLNVGYRHFNASRERALLLGCTSAPLMIDLFRDPKFIFDNPFAFAERFAGDPDEMLREGTFFEQFEGGLWETNFVADIRRVRLTNVEKRGKGLKHVYIALAGNVMKVHLAEFEVGTYKKAHRHGPGAHILILRGQGYSLMWPDGGEPKRYDWRPGSFISPPAAWWHQHFNTGSEPVFHIAFHRPQTVGGEGPREQIEYEDEDPRIPAWFEEALAANGAESRMRAGQRGDDRAVASEAGGGGA
jgi:quercetin dioxygenase-like cupin family protein